PARRRQPDAHAGKAARTAIDQDRIGASLIGQGGDHRHQPFGMAAPDDLMTGVDHAATLDQRDRAGGDRVRQRLVGRRVVLGTAGLEASAGDACATPYG
ncbi:hypothetical protein LTR94_033721, partial [Friedmanniomyces endolithicus]